jgi:hypothetical protein
MYRFMSATRAFAKRELNRCMVSRYSREIATPPGMRSLAG